MSNSEVPGLGHPSSDKEHEQQEHDTHAHQGGVVGPLGRGECAGALGRPVSGGHAG